MRKGVTPTDDPHQAPGAWHPAVLAHEFEQLNAFGALAALKLGDNEVERTLTGRVRIPGDGDPMIVHENRHSASEPIECLSEKGIDGLTELWRALRTSACREQGGVEISRGDGEGLLFHAGLRGRLLDPPIPAGEVELVRPRVDQFHIFHRIVGDVLPDVQ